MLRWNARRLDRPANGLREVGIRDGQVVLRGDQLRIADPVTDDLHGMLPGQFGFSRRAEIVEQFRPSLQPGLGDDPLQLRPQVLVRVSAAGDDELRSFGRFIPNRFQNRPQLGKQGMIRSLFPS